MLASQPPFRKVIYRVIVHKRPLIILQACQSIRVWMPSNLTLPVTCPRGRGGRGRGGAEPVGRGRGRGRKRVWNSDDDEFSSEATSEEEDEDRPEYEGEPVRRCQGIGP